MVSLKKPRRMRIEFGKTGAAFIVTTLLALGGWGWHSSLSRSNAEEAASTAKPNVADEAKETLHPVIIKRPEGPPKVATGLTNFHAQPVTVSCGACHATTKPNIETRASSDLDQFHQGLKYAHGNLTCLSCHNAMDYDSLRLADSRSVEFSDSMTMCSQCHGPQKRDYDMGLHGGMLGYWDLKKGGRTRNTCINCHDPHAPAFPLVMPVFPPRDRISTPVKANSTSAKH
jgi:nitrate reductase cytochrome c-type subunit